jgi:hypothetical protein
MRALPLALVAIAAAATAAVAASSSDTYGTSSLPSPSEFQQAAYEQRICCSPSTATTATPCLFAECNLLFNVALDFRTDDTAAFQSHCPGAPKIVVVPPARFSPNGVEKRHTNASTTRQTPSIAFDQTSSAAGDMNLYTIALTDPDAGGCAWRGVL